MNKIIKAMIERRSCKSFKSDMLPKEAIEKVIEAGLWAANGRGLQTPVIIAVTDKETRDKLSKLNAAVMGAESDPFYNAPVVLVVLAPAEHPNRVYDGSLVMGNMMLLDTPCKRGYGNKRGQGNSCKAWHGRRMGRHWQLCIRYAGRKFKRSTAQKRKQSFLD